MEIDFIKVISRNDHLDFECKVNQFLEGRNPKDIIAIEYIVNGDYGHGPLYTAIIKYR